MTYAFKTAEVSRPPSLREAPEFETLLADLRARRNEFTALRRIPVDIIDRFRRVGIYRALVARSFGGDEHSPADFCRTIEAIAEADGSAAWVASFGAAATYLAALPRPTLQDLYAGGPDVVFAGGLFPLQRAERIPQGFRIKGRWKFGSGCTGADLIGVGITADDGSGGLPRMAVMPASEVDIQENWDVIGLRGTGSHDLVVDDVEVRESWTLIRGGPPSVDAAVYRYPTLALAAQVLAAVGLGVARAALDELIAMAGGRASITGAPKMADRGYVQMEVAKAEATLRAARTFFYEAAEDTWRTVLAGDNPDTKQVSILRLAASNAARAGADVSRLTFMLAGTTAIYEGHALSRAMADGAVVAQHAFLSEGTFQSAGRLLLGLPAAPGFP